METTTIPINLTDYVDITQVTPNKKEDDLHSLHLTQVRKTHMRSHFPEEEKWKIAEIYRNNTFDLASLDDTKLLRRVEAADPNAKKYYNVNDVVVVRYKSCDKQKPYIKFGIGGRSGPAVEATNPADNPQNQDPDKLEQWGWHNRDNSQRAYSKYSELNMGTESSMFNPTYGSFLSGVTPPSITRLAADGTGIGWMNYFSFDFDAASSSFLLHYNGHIEIRNTLITDVSALTIDLPNEFIFDIYLRGRYIYVWSTFVAITYNGGSSYTGHNQYNLTKYLIDDGGQVWNSGALDIIDGPYAAPFYGVVSASANIISGRANMGDDPSLYTKHISMPQEPHFVKNGTTDEIWINFNLVITDHNLPPGDPDSRTHHYSYIKAYKDSDGSLLSTNLVLDFKTESTFYGGPESAIILGWFKINDEISASKGTKYRLIGVGHSSKTAIWTKGKRDIHSAVSTYDAILSNGENLLCFNENSFYTSYKYTPKPAPSDIASMFKPDIERQVDYILRKYNISKTGYYQSSYENKYVIINGRGGGELGSWIQPNSASPSSSFTYQTGASVYQVDPLDSATFPTTGNLLGSWWMSEEYYYKLRREIGGNPADLDYVDDPMAGQYARTLLVSGGFSVPRYAYVPANGYDHTPLGTMDGYGGLIPFGIYPVKEDGDNAGVTPTQLHDRIDYGIYTEPLVPPNVPWPEKRYPIEFVDTLGVADYPKTMNIAGHDEIILDAVFQGKYISSATIGFKPGTNHTISLYTPIVTSYNYLASPTQYIFIDSVEGRGDGDHGAGTYTRVISRGTTLISDWDVDIYPHHDYLGGFIAKDSIHLIFWLKTSSTDSNPVIYYVKLNALNGSLQESDTFTNVKAFTNYAIDSFGASLENNMGSIRVVGDKPGYRSLIHPAYNGKTMALGNKLFGDS